jgi:nicotinamide-nucleotide amidase
MATTPRAELVRDIVGTLDGRTVATAESCSGGRLGGALTSVDGASTWYRGGVVAYQEWVKRALLGVAAPSVFSERAAAEMAAGVARLLQAEVAIATSGVAGATPQQGCPQGTVFVATSVDGDARCSTHHVDGDRSAVSEGAVDIALRQVLDHLRDQGRRLQVVRSGAAVK